MTGPDVQIRNSDAMARLRNPVAVALLGFFTAGLYALYWYYKVNKEMAELGRARGTNELGDSPGTSLLAVTLGALIIVPAFVSIWNTCKRVNAASRLSGQPDPISVGLTFVIWIFLYPVAAYMQQTELNKVWQTEGEPPPGQPALGGQPAAGMPGEQPQAAPQQPAPPPPPPPSQ